MLSFAILPDSIIADPLSITPKNKFFALPKIKSVTLIDDFFFNIMVELSKYCITILDLSSVTISSLRKIESYNFNNLFSPSLFTAWTLLWTLTTVAIFSCAINRVGFNIFNKIINKKQKNLIPYNLLCKILIIKS